MNMKDSETYKAAVPGRPQRPNGPPPPRAPTGPPS